MKLAYGLYMAEAEGYLGTREQKLTRLKKEVANYPAYTMPRNAFIKACEKCGIKPESVNLAEMDYLTSGL